MREVVTHKPQETVELGRALARDLQPGDVIALTGELGSGKTCFTKGLALGLNIQQEITSPTFTLIHEYHGGRLPLHHVDLYRLRSIEEAIAIGVEEYLRTDGVTVIEWADRIEPLLPPHTRRIRLEATDEFKRRIAIS